MSLERDLESLAKAKANSSSSKQEISGLLRHSEKLIDKLITYNTKLIKQLRKEIINLRKSLENRSSDNLVIKKELLVDVQNTEREISDLIKENQYFRKEIKSIRSTLRNAQSIDSFVKNNYRNVFRLLKTLDEIPESKKIRYARLAKIPEEYYGNMTVRQKANGIVHIYFGGSDSPAGSGHGHCVIDINERLIYKRDPFTTRGRHNHIGPGRDNNGGFDALIYAYWYDKPITYAWGWGSKKGYTILAEGHLDIDAFRLIAQHQIFLPGEGPISNGEISELRI